MGQSHVWSLSMWVSPMWDSYHVKLSHMGTLSAQPLIAHTHTQIHSFLYDFPFLQITSSQANSNFIHTNLSPALTINYRYVAPLSFNIIITSAYYGSKLKRFSRCVLIHALILYQLNGSCAYHQLQICSQLCLFSEHDWSISFRIKMLLHASRMVHAYTVQFLKKTPSTRQDNRVVLGCYITASSWIWMIDRTRGWCHRIHTLFQLKRNIKKVP
jgi:hypothetical protein